MKRDAFLARVRRAQSSAVLPLLDAPDALFPQEGDRDLVAWFERTAGSLGVVVHHAQSPQGARGIVLSIARGAGIEVFTAWSEAAMPTLGVAAYLRTAGLREVLVDVPAAAGRDQAVRSLAEIGMGVTGADAAFARSGAVALVSGPGRSRMASLVPDVHVVLLEAARVEPSMSHWVAQHPDALGWSSNLVFVAGPSRSADIEMTLSVGVHGPKEVHIVLV